MNEENVNSVQDETQDVNLEPIKAEVLIPEGGSTIVLGDGVSFEISNVKIEQENRKKLTREEYDQFFKLLMTYIEDCDAVDNDSAEFSIDYDNRVVLDRIDLDLAEIETAAERALDEFFDVE